MLQPLWPGPIPGYSSGGSCPTLLSAWFWSTLFSSHCRWLPACSHRGIGWWDQAHPPGCSLGPGYLGATGALPAPAGTGGAAAGVRSGRSPCSVQRLVQMLGTPGASPLSAPVARGTPPAACGRAIRVPIVTTAAAATGLSGTGATNSSRCAAPGRLSLLTLTDRNKLQHLPYASLPLLPVLTCYSPFQTAGLRPRGLCPCQQGGGVGAAPGARGL